MSKKKIAIVGVLDRPESTNVWFGRGFKQNGWDVIPINYRTLISTNGEEAFYDYLLFCVDHVKPDLVLFSKINNVAPFIVKKVNNKIPTWYWFMDNIQVANAIQAVEYAKRAAFVSATSSEVVDLFEKYNSNTKLIIEGYEPEIFYPENVC